MKYGPLAPRKLPEQNAEKLLLLADRWQRASGPHEKWATTAKKCVDYTEGRQWEDKVRAAIERQGRPVLTFNEIFRLVRLVIGYQRNNSTDFRAMPGYDGTGQDTVAEAISRIFKQTAEQNEMESVDGEVFADGLISSRGYWDTRLNFDDNDFGEIRTTSVDPFRVKIDPDLDAYDLNKGSYVIRDEWASVDQVKDLYGQQAADLVAPLSKGSTPHGPILSLPNQAGEVSPIRAFGLEETDYPEWWQTYTGILGDMVDPARRNLRVLEFQYWQTVQSRVFVDLETGDRSPIPDDWDAQRIQKAVYYAELRQNPIMVRVQPLKKVRWTTVIGDLIVYDDWSPFDRFTLTGFFPWFRRGFTKGMVEDLLDPQDEVNKRHMATVETVMRTANSGWMYHEGSLDPLQERNLRNFGSAPGINVKWKGDAALKPTRIDPAAPPTSYERLEVNAEEKLNRISGVNESALGDLDRVQSGRAVEARQRQAVVSIQVYKDNFSRSKKMVGRNWLSIVQKHYTEQRMFRILGEDGKFVQFAINQQQVDPATGFISKINDVTAGKYAIVIDETPLSATFANAQFEEALQIARTLNVPTAALADIIIDLSSMPRKEEIKQRIQTLMGTASPNAMPPGGPGAPPPGLPAPHPETIAGGQPASNVVQLPVAAAGGA
ncbi:portal protein [Ferrovibrio sp.]|uniref:portal protein n=1 Tax=Ferrovibrio sp. TaxID=1917215 RepID=UPI00311FA306